MTIETRIAAEPIAEPKVKTVADVLRHAALIIEEYGWSPAALVDDHGGHCAWGAIAVAVHGPDGPCLTFGVSEILQCDAEASALDALADLVNPRRHSHAGGVAVWNDTPGRTAAEVTAALRAAADAAESAS